MKNPEVIDYHTHRHLIRVALVVGVVLGTISGTLGGWFGHKARLQGDLDVKTVPVGPCVVYAVTVKQKGTVWLRHCPDRHGLQPAPTIPPMDTTP